MAQFNPLAAELLPPEGGACPLPLNEGWPVPCCDQRNAAGVTFGDLAVSFVGSHNPGDKEATGGRPGEAF